MPSKYVWSWTCGLCGRKVKASSTSDLRSKQNKHLDFHKVKKTRRFQILAQTNR